MVGRAKSGVRAKSKPSLLSEGSVIASSPSSSCRRIPFGKKKFVDVKYVDFVLRYLSWVSYSYPPVSRPMCSSLDVLAVTFRHFKERLNTEYSPENFVFHAARQATSHGNGSSFPVWNHVEKLVSHIFSTKEELTLNHLRIIIILTHSMLAGNKLVFILSGKHHVPIHHHRSVYPSDAAARFTHVLAIDKIPENREYFTSHSFRKNCSGRNSSSLVHCYRSLQSELRMRN